MKYPNGGYMSKNEWLKRAEQRKATTTKSVRERAAESKKVVENIKKAVPDATVFVNCCTRDKIQIKDGRVEFLEPGTPPARRVYTSEALEESLSQDDLLHERWHQPATDEDICVPIRPTAEAKRYDHLQLMEDAMVVYQVGRSEPKGPTGPVGEPGPQGCPGEDYLGETEDVAYFKNKLFNAMKMPKEVSKKLASEDIKFAREYEKQTGESLCEWKELNSKELMQQAKLQKLEELKIQVMSQNPSYLGVPASQFSSSVSIGSQGFQGCMTLSGQNNNQQFHYSGSCDTLQKGTPIHFQPEQISYHTIGEDRRVFSIEVKPENSEKFIEKLKAEFRKKALKNVEAQAADSEMWFAPNGLNRGNIPNIIDVFADIAAEAYIQVSAKVDKMCNEVFLDTGFTINTPPPEGIVGAGSITITATSPTLMADSMIGGSIISGPTLSPVNGDYNINIGGC